jgi:micrococcal nuclease
MKHRLLTPIGIAVLGASLWLWPLPSLTQEAPPPEPQAQEAAPEPAVEAPEPATGPSMAEEEEPAPDGEVEATVQRVIDGDTVEVLVGTRLVRVRYLGMNTPERSSPWPWVKRWANVALQRNRELVGGRTVQLHFDSRRFDMYDRWLAYVFADGEMVNAKLVGEGLARANPVRPNTLYVDTFATLQAQAQRDKLGLWGDTGACP